jgi:hypothetical protein
MAEISSYTINTNPKIQNNTSSQNITITQPEEAKESTGQEEIIQFSCA